MAKQFDVSKVHHIGIYPTIGIARVGNSQLEDEGQGWYIGPEIPGRFATPPGGFKDPKYMVKRQAARFRVYAFDKDGNVLCEVTSGLGFEMDWVIEVANKKPAWYAFTGKGDTAFQPGYTTLRNPSVQPDLPPDERDKLIITSGSKKLSGPSASPVKLAGDFWGSRTDNPEHVYLGEAHTDASGRLVVLAGRGHSKSIADAGKPYPPLMTDFDSADWIDDTCDGWIDVTVKCGDKRFNAPKKARVIGTTPKFASEIYAPTTLYDVMEDIYEQKMRTEKGSSYSVARPGWYEHIWPLLQRPVDLAWVNGQANLGHGPNGPGHFSDTDWQTKLSDSSAVGATFRNNVLGRMRLPQTADKKYDQARLGQGFPYFMPWLSGDGGRTTAGDVSTFTAVTELQFDRLTQWARGNFDAPPRDKRPYLPASFDEIPLSEQPASLIKAQLDATIGSPLFPGIEMSWSAELPATYDLEAPFTIGKDVKPGDMTRYLSLPWQSDFYMCRNYWWPSARPDAIVTEHAVENAQMLYPIQNVSKALDEKRVPWERGLHQNYTDVFPDQPLFANTDMVRRWHQLGFIVKQTLESGEVIFVETQRNLRKQETVMELPAAGQQKKVAVTLDANATDLRHHGPLGGGIKMPKADDGLDSIKTMESLREHLRVAMAVELSTIPVYLAAMYSVKTPAKFVNDPRYSDPLVAAIRGIVSEEMLHLTLAGNILLAVGGQFKVYDPRYIPTYPGPMIGHSPPLMLRLRSLTEKQLEEFIRIEEPQQRHAPPQGTRYHTLGQFYKAIQNGLEYLQEHPDPKYPHLWDPAATEKQFSPGVGYQPRSRDAGGSVVVTDLESARDAIKIIVEQGEGEEMPEGGVSIYDDLTHHEESHYAIFKRLQREEQHSWELYPTISDPKTDQYEHVDRRIYQASVTFDAAYCFLLVTIDKIWELDAGDNRRTLVLGNLFAVMMGVLRPLAQFLVQQPLGQEGKNAAPCFGYYHFKKGRSALEMLQSEMQRTIDGYCAVDTEDADQVAITDFGSQLELLLPVQHAIASLIDLDTFERKDQAQIKKNMPGIQDRGVKGFAKGS